MSRCSCQVEHHDPICFRGSNVFCFEAIVEDANQAMNSNGFHSHSTETLIDDTVQISKTRMALADSANIAQLADLFSGYILFDILEERYGVLSKLGQGFKPCEQSHLLLHGEGAVHNKEDTDSAM